MTKMKVLLDHKNKKISDLQAMLNTAQEQTSELISEIKEKAQQIEDLEDNIKTIQGEFKIEENKTKEKVEQIEQLSIELSDQEKEIKNLYDALAQSESISSDLKSNIQSNDQILKATLGENEFIKSQLSSTVEEIKNMSIDFENKKSSLEHKMSQITKSKNFEIGQLLEQTEYLKIQIATKDVELKSQMETSETSTTEFQSKIISLNGQIESKNNELSQALEKIRHLEAQFVSKNSEIQETTGQKVSSQCQIDENKKLKKELEEAKTKATTVEENLKERIEVTHI